MTRCKRFEKKRRRRKKENFLSPKDLENAIANRPCTAGILTADQHVKLKKGDEVVLTAEQRDYLRECYASTTPAWSYGTTITVIRAGLEDLDPAPLNLPVIPIDGFTQVITSVKPDLPFFHPKQTTYPPINPLNPFLPRNVLDSLWYPSKTDKDCFELLSGPYEHPQFPKGYYIDNCGRAIPKDYFVKHVEPLPTTQPPTTTEIVTSTIYVDQTEPPTVPTTKPTFPPCFLGIGCTTTAGDGKEDDDQFKLRVGEGTAVENIRRT